MTIHDERTPALPSRLLVALCAASCLRIRRSEAFVALGGRRRPAAISSIRLLPSEEEWAPDILGLTDDGDFAMTGINTDHPVSRASHSSDAVPILDGLSISGMGISSFDDPIAERDDGFTSSDDVVDRRGDDEIRRVEAWLSKLLPALNPNDLTAYSRELVSIGFDPECVSRFEVRFDDLRFMKLLHRRYVYSELTGAGHPSPGDGTGGGEE